MDRAEHDRRVASDTAAYEQQVASRPLNTVGVGRSLGALTVLQRERNGQWSSTPQPGHLAYGWARVISERMNTVCLVLNSDTGQVFASYRHGEKVI